MERQDPMTRTRTLAQISVSTSRYATFGFSDAANLDEGALWPIAFALEELTAAEEARIGALVKKAKRTRTETGQVQFLRRGGHRNSALTCGVACGRWRI
jgi:hypothetical protein